MFELSGSFSTTRAPQTDRKIPPVGLHFVWIQCFCHETSMCVLQQAVILIPLVIPTEPNESLRPLETVSHDGWTTVVAQLEEKKCGRTQIALQTLTGPLRSGSAYF